jgi:hypothetical protein
MKTPMPKIDLNKLAAILTPAELKLAQGIVNPKTGALRASKPPVKHTRQTSVLTGCERRVTDLDAIDPHAQTAYLWRMTAFQISVLPKHWCLPVCADSDLPMFGAERRALTATLDVIVKKIVDTLPPEEWHGIKRWGQAYGLVGTPQVRESGSIVYR